MRRKSKDQPDIFDRIMAWRLLRPLQPFYQKYKEILLDLKEKYKTAKFVIITTVLKHEMKLEYILDEVCAELADPDVTRYKFRRAGKATDGHPRITEQEEMANELADYIRTIV